MALASEDQFCLEPNNPWQIKTGGSWDGFIENLSNDTFTAFAVDEE
jgi:hypothetical protein